MEPFEVIAKPESNPVVFEVYEPGGRAERKMAILLPPGSPGTKSEISISPQSWTAKAGGFEFTASDFEVEENSREAEDPVLILIPVECRAATDVEDGTEAATSVTLALTVGSGPAQSVEIRLVGSVNHVLPPWKVLLEEYETLKPEWKEGLHKAIEGKASDDGKLDALYAFVHARGGQDGDGLSALCLSGGGIRSATFNLGTIQGLAGVGVLPQFQYLSSVSGGGYIASWLGSWIHRARKGREEVFSKLRNDQPDPAHPEAEPITHLRQYSNYLTPKLGLLSADTWTITAIVVRNLLLNLLVLVPVLAGLLAIPLLFVGRPLPVRPPSPDLFFGAAVFFGGVSLWYMSLLRAEARVRKRGKKEQEEDALTSSGILARGLLPLLTATPLMVTAVAGFAARRAGEALDTWEVIVRCLIWSVVMPLVAFLLSVPAQKRIMGRRRAWLKADVIALLLSGAVEAGIYFGILKKWLPLLLDSPWHLYAILAPGLLLGPLLLGKTLFIAFASFAEERGYPSDLGDGDREWWARWSGWILLCSLLWIFLAALVILGPLLLHALWAKVSAAIGAAGLGGIVTWLGKSAGTPSKQGESASPVKSLTMALAAPLFCILVLLLISVGTQELLRALPTDLTGSTGPETDPYCGYALVLLGVIALLVGVGAFMGRFVNVNRFSLQAMYRNRLVRAYMGASNACRQPNPFTGFDPEDNLRLHWLQENRPWPVVNVALNLVSGEDLAWQQRKAESFTATPLHCGTGQLGYRRSQVYGGQHGLSLGTAVATSGAAANPNMGYSSSPFIGFLMTVFNARLGAWLGNPGPLGKTTYTRSGPRSSMLLLAAEALGMTDSRHPYVNLSDGGHFENLGIYEMVRRRCHFIVVGDAGCDPACGYDDLGNAIRKIRIDFGVPIDFEGDIQIYPKTSGKPPQDARYCAVARIRYSAVDPGGIDGTLIYVKPAICDGITYDIYNYSKTSRDFPHETTADQWFSESQFESYRALGQGAITDMTKKGPHQGSALTLRQFEEDVRAYVLGQPSPPPSSAGGGGGQGLTVSITPAASTVSPGSTPTV